MEIVSLDSNSFKEKVLESKGAVLVDFYATWCGPCKMLAPILEQVSQENDNITIAKLDIDEGLEIAKEFGIMSVPTMVLFKDGKEQDRLMGLRPKKAIEDAINKIVE